MTGMARLSEAANGRVDLSAEAADVFIALAATIRECRLPVPLLHDLVGAFRQDVTVRRYATWPDLLDYCRRSANPVGRLVLRVAGVDDPAADAASDAVCTALQLTNFWQDLEIDWLKGRLYVPEEIRRATGAHRGGSGCAAHDARVARGAARRRGTDARSLRRRPPGLRSSCTAGCAWSCARHGWAARSVLAKLEAAGFDVFRARPRLSAVDAVGIAARADRLAGRLRRRGARHQLLLFLSGPPAGPAPRDRRGVGFLPRRRRCGG